MPDFDIVSYLMGKAAGGGGGGGGSATIVSKAITENGTYNASADNADGYSPVVVNVSGGDAIIGTVPPSQSVGQDGQYYIYQTSAPTVYLIKITKAGRDTNKDFNYWGAREIDLIFTDGENDYHFRDFTGANCKYAAGNGSFMADNGVIDGATGNYLEHSGLPGWYEFSAEIPGGCEFKTLSICGRNNSSWKDFWVTFEFGQESAAGSKSFANTIISESDLSYSDWDHTTQDSFTDFSPSAPIAPVDLYAVDLYYKYGGEWILVAS